MRRIKQIEALDVLIAWNRTGFYKIDLNYGLISPRAEFPGEDGQTQPRELQVSKKAFSPEDFRDPDYRATGNMLTIGTLQSRD